MISNPKSIFYACIAKGSVILGEFLSKEHELAENLAQKCINNTPPYHSLFYHSVGKRTYVFFIHDPFTYFGIFDSRVGKSDCIWLLNELKSAFEAIPVEFVVAPGCFQAKFYAVLGEIVSPDFEHLKCEATSLNDVGRNSSVDSVKSGRTAVAPLLGQQGNNGLKKKKRSPGEKEVVVNGDAREIDAENKVDVSDDVVIQKNSMYAVDRQKAKQIWKKHVWIVLVLDLFICAVLFGIWLWVCRGFQCIDG